MVTAGLGSKLCKFSSLDQSQIGDIKALQKLWPLLKIGGLYFFVSFSSGRASLGIPWSGGH